MKLVYWCGYTLFKGIAKFFFSYEIVHRERLVEDGATLVASNHASFLDPPMVGIAYRSAIYYLARKTLFRGFFGWLYRNWNSIPVDQERADFTSLKTIIKLLKKGERVVVFPEGQRSWDGTLLEGQPGVGLVIAKAGVPVQPVRLFGTFEALGRGIHWPRVVRITLVVGEPIMVRPEDFDERGKDLYRAMSDHVMAAISALELPPGREP